MLNNYIFKTGDTVRIISLKQSGIIASISEDGNAKIAIGSLTIRVKISDLEIYNGNNKEQKTNKYRKTARLKSPTSLDLHGLTSKEAMEALLKFISDAILSEHPQVSVIHGHGSGTIKRMVQNTLAEMECVASFRHPINNSAETKIYFR